jgi:hypothetical protein
MGVVRHHQAVTPPSTMTIRLCDVQSALPAYTRIVYDSSTHAKAAYDGSAYAGALVCNDQQ